MVPILHNAALYRLYYTVENMFGKLKDRRPTHTRYDRCTQTSVSAICIDSSAIFWLQ